MLSTAWTPAPRAKKYRKDEIPAEAIAASPTGGCPPSQVSAILGSLVVAAPESQGHSGHGTLPLEAGMSPETTALGAALLTRWASTRRAVVKKKNLVSGTCHLRTFILVGRGETEQTSNPLFLTQQIQTLLSLG